MSLASDLLKHMVSGLEKQASFAFSSYGNCI